MIFIDSSIPLYLVELRSLAPLRDAPVTIDSIEIKSCELQRSRIPASRDVRCEFIQEHHKARPSHATIRQLLGLFGGPHLKSQEFVTTKSMQVLRRATAGLY